MNDFMPQKQFEKALSFCISFYAINNGLAPDELAHELDIDSGYLERVLAGYHPCPAYIMYKLNKIMPGVLLKVFDDIAAYVPFDPELHETPADRRARFMLGMPD